MLADLDIAYIERTPRYWRSQDSDLKGLAFAGLILKSQKRWPAEKEKISYVAHVVNNGADLNQEFRYSWLVNNVLQAVGFSPGLAPGQEAQIIYQREFRETIEQVAFQIDPLQEIEEAGEENNYLAVGSRDLAFSVWIDKDLYEDFQQNKNYLGSYSFGDWLQAHFKKANEKVSLQGWSFQARLDKVVIAQQGTADFNRDPDSAFFDGRWHLSRDGKGAGAGINSNFKEINQKLVQELISRLEKVGFAGR